MNKLVTQKGLFQFALWVKTTEGKHMWVKLIQPDGTPFGDLEMEQKPGDYHTGMLLLEQSQKAFSTLNPCRCLVNTPDGVQERRVTIAEVKDWRYLTMEEEPWEQD